MKVLTEADLRARYIKTDLQEVYVQEGTIVTPTALDFIKEKGLKLIRRSNEQNLDQSLPLKNKENASGKEPKNISDSDSEIYSDKPEHMTQLQSDVNPMNSKEIPVEVSARHVHLSPEHIEVLFGREYQLKPKRALSQPGQFLCEERVKIITPKAEIPNVAILGPARTHTQVEISVTDARLLGINPPIRQSGDLAGSEAIYIVSSKGMVKAEQSVIITRNHIHMDNNDAKGFGVRDNQLVKVRIQSARPLTFEDVIIRVNDSFRLNMHIDYDEANACGFTAGTMGELMP